MASKRYATFKLLESALKDITKANGYPQTVTVAAARLKFGDDDKKLLPLVAVVEKPEQPVVTSRGGNDIELQSVVFIVQGFCVNNPDAPMSSAYDLLASIQQRLRPEEVSFFGHRNRGLADVSIAPGYVLADKDGTGITGCLVEVTINVNELLNDPNQPFQ